MRYLLVALPDEEAREDVGQRLEDARDLAPLIQWADVEPRWNAIIANVEQTFGSGEVITTDR